MGPTGSTSHVSNLVAGNSELAGHPLMEAAYNGFFKDIFLMSLNDLTAAGIVLSESTTSSQRYRTLTEKERSSKEKS